MTVSDLKEKKKLYTDLMRNVGCISIQANLEESCTCSSKCFAETGSFYLNCSLVLEGTMATYWQKGKRIIAGEALQHGKHKPNDLETTQPREGIGNQRGSPGCSDRAG